MNSQLFPMGAKKPLVLHVAQILLLDLNHLPLSCQLKRFVLCSAGKQTNLLGENKALPKARWARTKSIIPSGMVANNLCPFLGFF